VAELGEAFFAVRGPMSQKLRLAFISFETA
jgi:hypothetical protein